MDFVSIRAVDGLKVAPAPRVLHDRVDRIGAGMSFACAIHCVLMPLVIGILPLIGLGFLADHTAERIFVGFSICLAVMSLCWGFRTHGRAHLFWILIASASLIGTGLFIVSEQQHVYFVVAGAVGIAITHLMNRRLCRSCTHCEVHCHDEKCSSLDH